MPQPPLSVALDWKVVAASPYLPAALVEVRQPLQARSTIAGITPDGYSSPGAPVVFRVYRAGAAGAGCAFVDLIAPQADRPRPGLRLTYAFASGGRTIARGRLDAGARRRILVPIKYRSGRSDFQFQLTGKGTITATGGVKLGLQVGNFDTLPSTCP
jgi:hypothetical protein